jgi:hypothetical protein
MPDDSSISYPLILCLELQCTLAQQERVAQLLMELFGDRLFLDQSSVCNEFQVLPSPHELRGKIIIKVKRLISSFENHTRLF